jgi:hypothetical protein
MDFLPDGTFYLEDPAALKIPETSAGSGATATLQGPGSGRRLPTLDTSSGFIDDGTLRVTDPDALAVPDPNTWRAADPITPVKPISGSGSNWEWDWETGLVRETWMSTIQQDQHAWEKIGKSWDWLAGCCEECSQGSENCASATMLHSTPPLPFLTLLSLPDNKDWKWHPHSIVDWIEVLKKMQEKKEKELAGEIRLEEIRKAISPDRPPRGTGVYGQYCWALVMQKQADRLRAMRNHLRNLRKCDEEYAKCLKDLRKMAPALCDIAYGSYCDSLGALMAVAVILNPWAAAALTFFGTLAVIDCLDEQRKVCAKTDFDEYTRSCCQKAWKECLDSDDGKWPGPQDYTEDYWVACFSLKLDLPMVIA